MEPKINYIALLILIILGVALGNLASSWFTVTYMERKDEKEIIDAPEVATKDLSKNIEPLEPLKPREVKDSTKAEVIRETVKLSPKSQNEAEKIAAPANPKQLIEQRKLDENGVKLAKKCNEWTVVHKDMNTPSSERGMNKHCSEYYDYLSFGTLPDPN